MKDIQIDYNNPCLRFGIDGIMYQRSDKPIEKGDLIFDMRDATYGVCDMTFGEDHIAVRHRGISELGVPAKMCFKLIPSLASLVLN